MFSSLTLFLRRLQSLLTYGARSAAMARKPTRQSARNGRGKSEPAKKYDGMLREDFEDEIDDCMSTQHVNSRILFPFNIFSFSTFSSQRTRQDYAGE